MKTDRHFSPQKPCLLGISLALLIGAVVLVASFFQIGSINPALCSVLSFSVGRDSRTPSADQLLQRAILHYATSKTVPQQTLPEITVTYDVLQSDGPLSPPLNFLVFGLGHDSLMWASFNPGGTTLFLEEDPKWIQAVLKESPSLRAHAVPYRTKLSEADSLLAHYHGERGCWPSQAHLRGNRRCRLALDALPDEVYDREWDVIMIDAPRGYFPEAPGRMGAIYSAAVMARKRKGSGATHVFLHDVDRKVEKVYAELFLCRKHLVKAVGRLWHFRVPPAGNVSHEDVDGSKFC